MWKLKEKYAYNSSIAPVLVRASLRARITQTPYQFLTIFALSIFSLMPFLANLGVPNVQLALWAIPLIVLFLVKGVVSRWIENSIEEFTDRELVGADWALRITSILNQTLVGSGIWIMSSPLSDSMIVPLCMTLITLLWAIGVMTNLSSDFPTFVLSMPMLIGQPTIFWLMYGGFGLSIGFCMFTIACLMLISVSHSTHVFRDNIITNLEKDQLLQRIRDANAKTQNALREAQLANSAKAYLMATAAHDVKQPLLALGMLTDTVLLSDIPESVVPLVRQQRSSIDQMSDYFDALMDMRSFLKGDYELSCSRFRLDEFGAHIGSEIAPLCAAKGLKWQLEMDHVLVDTDYQLLQRLFRNLLINAVRYTDNGEIRCSAKADGDVVRFLVSDTGMGIAAEHQEVVFEDFVRLRIEGLDASGSGLGLSIVRKISEALELDLQMSSTLGKGTRFSFRLPVVS